MERTDSITVTRKIVRQTLANFFSPRFRPVSHRHIGIYCLRITFKYHNS